jgi:hypothetical protein
VLVSVEALLVLSIDVELVLDVSSSDIVDVGTGLGVMRVVAVMVDVTLGSVQVLESSQDVVEDGGGGGGGGGGRVDDGLELLFWHNALTRFPFCASYMSVFGFASTVTHDARMFDSTRRSACLHALEHWLVFIKSARSHPNIGVL